MILEVLMAAISAGVLVVLIAWGVSCTRCTELREELKRATTERDTALADLKYTASCECCAYGCKNLEVDHCFDCGEKECRCRNCLGGDCWEWRGLVAENATAESEGQTND